MGLPRTFVGFSSTDIRSYWLMCAWKNNSKIDFNFLIVSWLRKLILKMKPILKRSVESASIWLELLFL